VLYWDDGDPSRRGTIARPIGGAICSAMALLCKENAITLVGVVALLDWYRGGLGRIADRGRFWARRVLRCYLPLLLIIGGYLMLRQHMLGSLTTGGEVIDYFENYIAHPDRGIDTEAGESAALVRWGTPLAAMYQAGRLTLVPNALCFDYSYAAFEPVRRPGDPRLWRGVVLLAGLVVAIVLSARRRRRVALAIGLSAVTYSVVSNVVIVIGTIFGERLLYLPNVGYCMLIGLAADFAFRRGPQVLPGHVWLLRRGLAVALMATGILYAYLTVERNGDWHSNRRLYESAYRVNPRSCKTLSGMAAKARSDGDFRKALEYCNAVFHEKTGVAPEYWPVWRTAGLVLRRMGELAPDPQQKRFYTEQALAYFAKALRLGAAGDPDAMLGAADLFVELKGDYGEAIDIAGKLVGYRPTQARGHDRLARWLLTAEPRELRNPERALEHAREAHRLRPEVGNYTATLSDALAALERDAEAIQVIREAMKGLPPDSPGVAEFQKRLDRLESRAGRPDSLPPSATQPQDQDREE
jgi:tetratricopeptide (TPR) repeat protein